MNRKQRTCIVCGFLLIALSLLFAPTHPYRSPVVSYRFLLTGQGSIDFARLFAEWVLIVLVVSGLFFLQRKPQTRTPANQEFARLMEEAKRLGVDVNSGDEPLDGLESPKTNVIGKLWLQRFKIPIVVALAILTIGLAYYGSRRIPRNLPQTEDSKLAGGAYISNYGHFEWNAYNGSDFVLTEVRVSISVFDQNGSAVISKRVYRVPAYDFYPQQTKQLSTDVGFTLYQGQTWSWFVVGAKGRPEKLLSFETGEVGPSQVQTSPVAPTVSPIKLPEQTRRKTWLDEPLKDWNSAGSTLPENNRPSGIPVECKPHTRDPYNETEKALRDKGWLLIDSDTPSILSDPRYSDISVVEAVAGFGGMCRAEPRQVFVFYHGMFVGTLTPVLSYEDPILSTIRIVGPLLLEAEFLSYLPTDARCCPSIRRSVSHAY